MVVLAAPFLKTGAFFGRHLRYRIDEDGRTCTASIGFGGDEVVERFFRAGGIERYGDHRCINFNASLLDGLP